MHFLRLTCRANEVDLLSGDLWEAGTEGLQELDHGDIVELIAGFEDANVGPELLQRFAAYAPEWEAQPDTDWIAYTHAEWPPREIGKRIFLAPHWYPGETPSERVRIVHNPGSASGTGEHPCTQMMLETLETCIRSGQTVLDVGTGSGVLAIAAMHLGASHAYAIDTDEDALRTARENFEWNGLHPSLAAGSVECVADACADIVLANISGTVLLSIFDDLLRVVRPTGRLILSGFTEGELKAFLDLLPQAEVMALNEWRCVSAPSSLEPDPRHP